MVIWKQESEEDSESQDEVGLDSSDEDAEVSITPSSHVGATTSGSQRSSGARTSSAHRSGGSDDSATVGDEEDVGREDVDQEEERVEGPQHWPRKGKGKDQGKKTKRGRKTPF